MATRRDAARDRAEQAQAYRDLTVARTAEHATFADTMRARVEAQENAIHELEVALTSAQKRAAEATRKLNTEARRADLAEHEGRATAGLLGEAEERAAEAIVRVAELEAGARRAAPGARRLAGHPGPPPRLTSGSDRRVDPHRIATLRSLVVSARFAAEGAAARKARQARQATAVGGRPRVGQNRGP